MNIRPDDPIEREIGNVVDIALAHDPETLGREIREAERRLEKIESYARKVEEMRRKASETLAARRARMIALMERR